MATSIISPGTFRLPSTLKEILARPQENAIYRLFGWARHVRTQSHLAFVSLHDGSGAPSEGELQCVIDKSRVSADLWASAIDESQDGQENQDDKQAKKLTQHCSLTCTGKLIKSPKAGQEWELQVTDFQILGASDPSQFPFSKRGHDHDHFRKYPHLRPRVRLLACIARIRDGICQAIHQFFREHQFRYVHTPIITASDCEGAGELFAVDHRKKPTDPPFFKKPVFLTCSGQLTGEAYATALGRIYTFGPTFRAERSNTSRHLSEFWMIEPEMAFCDLPMLMDLAEVFVKACLQYVLKEHRADLEFIQQVPKKIHDGTNLIEKLEHYATVPYIRLPYTQAVEQLQQVYDADYVQKLKKYQKKQKKKQGGSQRDGGQSSGGQDGGQSSGGQDGGQSSGGQDGGQSSGGRDGADQDSADTDKVQSELPTNIPCLFEVRPTWGIDLGSEHERYLTEVLYKQTPVMVYDYPATIKAFYMKLNSDGKTVAALDLLVPGIGELIGGSQREEDPDILLKKIHEAGLDESSYSAYMDLRRFGTVVHSGFGLGLERLVMLATGTHNIKDTIPFPRYPDHAEF